MRKRLIWIAPLAILGIVIFTWIGGELVMLLWNWLLPTLFGWRQITFWQAIGLLALCRILFGGFRLGGHGSPRSRLRQRMEERCKNRMEERCKNMPPEERERFRQRMRERFGFGPSTGESKEQ
jgi:hypothetical protein